MPANCTDEKEKKIFLMYKEIQMRSCAKSYVRKGFLIYEEMDKYLVIYEEAVSHIQGASGIVARFLKCPPASAVSPIMTKFSHYNPHSICYLVLVSICRQD